MVQDKWVDFENRVMQVRESISPETITTWGGSVKAWAETDKLYGELSQMVKAFASVSIYSVVGDNVTFQKNQDGSDQKLPVMIQKLENCWEFRVSGRILKVQQKTRKVFDKKTHTWNEVGVYTPVEMKNPIENVKVQAYMKALSPTDMQTFMESKKFFRDSYTILDSMFEDIKKCRRDNSLTPPSPTQKIVGGTIRSIDSLGASLFNSINDVLDSDIKNSKTYAAGAALLSRFIGKKETSHRIEEVDVNSDIDNIG